MYTHEAIRRVLRDVHARKLALREAFERLKHLPYEALRSARLDHHRVLRKGLPEGIYAPGKSTPELVEILRAMCASGAPFVVTRLTGERFEEIAGQVKGLAFSPVARLAYPAWARRLRKRVTAGTVMILSGGSSDAPVAEEAALSLEVLGHRVLRAYDCGVAGLQRVLDQIPRMRRADVLICIAGMEGALASVVAGLTDRPVIAVPTAVGYGAQFEGLSALLTMLNSCAQGVAVVNIGNGYGAACMAHLILGARARKKRL